MVESSVHRLPYFHWKSNSDACAYFLCLFVCQMQSSVLAAYDYWFNEITESVKKATFPALTVMSIALKKLKVKYEFLYSVLVGKSDPKFNYPLVCWWIDDIILLDSNKRFVIFSSELKIRSRVDKSWHLTRQTLMTNNQQRISGLSKFWDKWDTNHDTSNKCSRILMIFSMSRYFNIRH